MLLTLSRFYLIERAVTAFLHFPVIFACAASFPKLADFRVLFVEACAASFPAVSMPPMWR